MMQYSSFPFSARRSHNPYKESTDYIDRNLCLKTSQCSRCHSSSLEVEIEILQKKSTFALRDSWDEINTLESTLSKWLNKIGSLEEEIRIKKEYEKDIRLRIKILEDEIRSYSEPKDDETLRSTREQLEQKIASQNRVILAMEEAIYQNSLILNR